MLTGRLRLRRGFLGKAILQAEHRVPIGRWVEYWPGWSVWKNTVWKDVHYDELTDVAEEIDAARAREQRDWDWFDILKKWNGPC